jgi:hypothetical protein
MPLLGGFIPYYNAEPWIARSIRSWKEQSFQDWSLLIVFDGLDPEALRTVEEAIAGDARISVEVREHAGLGATRNHAYSRAGGEVVLSWDADQWFLTPKALQAMVDELGEHPEADFVYGDYMNSWWAEQRGLLVRQKVDAMVAGRYAPVFDKGALKLGNYIDNASMFRRAKVGEARDDFPCDPDLPALVDWDMWLTLVLGPESANGRRIGRTEGLSGTYLPGMWFEAVRRPEGVTAALAAGRDALTRRVLAKHGLDEALADVGPVWDNDREGIVADLLAQRERGTAEIERLTAEIERLPAQPGLRCRRAPACLVSRGARAAARVRRAARSRRGSGSGSGDGA